MTLEQALHYIHAVCWKGSIPGLERINALLDKLDHPERACKFVHVAGTNGKGSTCAMLASIFQAAGYKTGLYTSPYILRFNERIQVNGQQIPDEAICELTEYIKPFADEFDATNVILPPEAAVLCNIGLDHTEVLGDTLEKIAATKSGIIKPGCDAVIYREQPSVEAVFEARCKAVGARLHKADFDSIRLESHGLSGQVFSCGRFQHLKLPLLGEHQLHNAAVVLAAVDALKSRGWNLTDEAVRTGLETVQWPGRFQLMREKPLFIVDGGHNPQCIEALVKNIDDYLQGKDLTVLTGVLGDKDYHCMYKNVAPYAKEFITITPDNPRAMQAADLAAYLRGFGKPVTACGVVEDGVKLAIEHAGENGVVLCYGSLYMIGDIDAALKKFS